MISLSLKTFLSRNYLLSECFIKNNKKYGTETAFNYKKDIIIRQMEGMGN